jgi:hypothetical protein
MVIGGGVRTGAAAAATATARTYRKMWRGLLVAATEPAAAIVKLAPGARLTAGRGLVSLRPLPR